MFSQAVLAFPAPTFENHLRYHFEGSDDDYVPNGRVIVDIGSCRKEPGNLIDEGARAARLIADSTRSPIWLCLSGGVDSEAMAHCFLRAKVPFRAAIMRFPGELNFFDIRWAIEFCEREGISFEFFDIDILDFYARDRHLDHAKLYRCRSPQLAVHIELMKLIPGFPVMSWNIPNVVTVERPGEAHPRASPSLPSDHYFCYHRYFERERRAGVAFFFAYTPELLYAGLRLPLIQELIFDVASARRPIGLNYEAKIEALRQGGFDVVAREGKFTGFEKVKDHFDRTSGIGPGAYEKLFRRPMEALSTPPREEIYRISKKYFRVRADQSKRREL